MRKFIIFALLMLPMNAWAQYENFNNHELEHNMTGSMMLPTVIVDMPTTLGSGTVIYSNYLDLPTICKVEAKAFPVDPLCAGKTEGQKQVRTYVLTAWHVMEPAYFPPPKKNEKKSMFRRLWEQAKPGIIDAIDFWQQKICPDCKPAEGKKEEPPPPKPKMVDKPPEVGVIVRIAASTGEMDIDYKRHNGALVAYDEDRDLALIRIADDTIFPYVAAVAPRDVDLEPARMVWAVGAPRGVAFELTGGYLSGRHQRIGKDTYYLSSANITHGNSGGGLYHYSRERKRFELIGVSDAIIGDDSHITLSVRTPEIHDFLDAGFTFIPQ